MTKQTDNEKVSAHIDKLPESVRPAVDYLRKVILACDKEIAEHVKWNSPAFYYSGKMKPFDAKEYKRDLIVINLRNKKIMCVLPTGAKLKRNTEILEGDYTDGRRLINFKDLADIKAKEGLLKKTIREWLEQIEK